MSSTGRAPRRGQGASHHAQAITKAASPYRHSARACRPCIPQQDAGCSAPTRDLPARRAVGNGRAARRPAAARPLPHRFGNGRLPCSARCPRCSRQGQAAGDVGIPASRSCYDARAAALRLMSTSPAAAWAPRRGGATADATRTCSPMGLPHSIEVTVRADEPIQLLAYEFLAGQNKNTRRAPAKYSAAAVRVRRLPFSSRGGNFAGPLRSCPLHRPFRPYGYAATRARASETTSPPQCENRVPACQVTMIVQRGESSRHVPGPAPALGDPLNANPRSAEGWSQRAAVLRAKRRRLWPLSSTHARRGPSTRRALRSSSRI